MLSTLDSSRPVEGYNGIFFLREPFSGNADGRRKRSLRRLFFLSDGGVAPDGIKATPSPGSGKMCIQGDTPMERFSSLICMS